MNLVTQVAAVQGAGRPGRCSDGGICLMLQDPWTIHTQNQKQSLSAQGDLDHQLQSCTKIVRSKCIALRHTLTTGARLAIASSTTGLMVGSASKSCPRAASLPASQQNQRHRWSSRGMVVTAMSICRCLSMPWHATVRVLRLGQVTEIYFTNHTLCTACTILALACHGRDEANNS